MSKLSEESVKVHLFNQSLPRVGFPDVELDWIEQEISTFGEVVAARDNFKRLMELLDHESEDIRRKAVILVMKLAKKNNVSQYDAIINAGVVPHLVKWINPESFLINSLLNLQTLNYLIQKAPELRVCVLESGVVDKLCEFSHFSLASFWHVFTGCLKNLFRGMEPISSNIVLNLFETLFQWIRFGIVEFDPQELRREVKRLEDEHDMEWDLLWEPEQGSNLISNVVWILGFLIDATEPVNDLIQYIDNSRYLSNFVFLLVNSNSEIQMAALKMIGSIAGNSDNLLQKLLHAGVLEYFLSLLRHCNKNIRKNTLCCLSTITTHSQSQIQAVIDAGIIGHINAFSLRENDFAIQREAIWVIRNLTNCGNAKQVTFIVTNEILSAICSFLTVEDDTVVEAVLDTLRNMMIKVPNSDAVACLVENCGGLRKIEVVQRHKNKNIYRLACQITEEFFGGETLSH